MGRTTASCLALLAVALGAASPALGAQPLRLGSGEAVAIGGSDVVCVHGGPENDSSISCLHTKARGVYSFRIDETYVRVFARRNSRTKEVRRFAEPRSVAQPRSPAVRGFKLVATLRDGARFWPVGLDLLCLVSVLEQKPVAVCAKIASAQPVGYGVSLGPKGVVVADYAKQGVVFSGTEG